MADFSYGYLLKPLCRLAMNLTVFLCSVCILISLFKLIELTLFCIETPVVVINLISDPCRLTLDSKLKSILFCDLKCLVGITLL